ncbi:MAG: YceD family protein [Acidimicrobiales bacterium]
MEVLLESVHSGILATGTISAAWGGECRRCLTPTQGHIAVRVRELFELGGGSEESYSLAGDQLDLEPMARDAVVLELPLAPLCSNECRGLCPGCGVNRNETSCSCVVAPDRRWAALDALKEGRDPQL